MRPLFSEQGIPRTHGGVVCLALSSSELAPVCASARTSQNTPGRRTGAPAGRRAFCTLDTPWKRVCRTPRHTASLLLQGRPCWAIEIGRSETHKSRAEGICLSQGHLRRTRAVNSTPCFGAYQLLDMSTDFKEVRLAGQTTPWLTVVTIRPSRHYCRPPRGLQRRTSPKRRGSRSSSFTGCLSRWMFGLVASAAGCISSTPVLFNSLSLAYLCMHCRCHFRPPKGSALANGLA